MKKNESNIKEVKLDHFTERLKTVFDTLFKIGAVAKKKDLVDLIGINEQNLINTQKGLRNFPMLETKRLNCSMKLFDSYGVNPDYLNSKSESMFLREPQKVERVKIKEALTYNFRDKNEKLKLIEERDEWRRKYFECAMNKGMVAEPGTDYNPDKEADKKEDDTKK